MDKDGENKRIGDINGTSGIHEFAMLCREYNQKLNNPQTEAEKLVYRMTHGKKTKEEYLKLEEDVIKFVASDASEEDKRKVGGYTESLRMICNSIREGRL